MLRYVTLHHVTLRWLEASLRYITSMYTECNYVPLLYVNIAKFRSVQYRYISLHALIYDLFHSVVASRHVTFITLRYVTSCHVIMSRNVIVTLYHFK